MENPKKLSTGPEGNIHDSRMALDLNERDRVVKVFRESGALLEGHFVLRSGRHSGHFFQCAQVCQYLDRVGRLAELLVRETADLAFDTVVAPAMGGLVIGQEVARQAGARYLFVEKTDTGLELRRNFQIAEGEPILIVEDVITRGGRVIETMEIVRAHGGIVAGVAVLVDRSEGQVDFGVPLRSLVELSFPTYDPEALPEALRSLPVTKPGS